jgi:virginiamycin B lyase
MCDMRILVIWLAVLLAAAPALGDEIRYFAVPPGEHPHDVAPSADGGVWYTGQRTGVLGHLDPATGKVDRTALGKGSSPHGVIVGPDGAAWITDGGLNAIVRVDSATREVKSWALPKDRPAANLNTAAFDTRGRIWFTGQGGVYGRLDPASGVMQVWDAPKGRGPYGIAATPDGGIWFVSLAGSYLAHVDSESGAAEVISPPTKDQGARRVWPDSKGRLWISEWNAGNVSVYDPASKAWKTWKLPGQNPTCYAVYVDAADKVWLTDFTANAILKFDPATEKFEPFPSDQGSAAVRQLNGRPGEVWGAESANDRLVMIKQDAIR